MNLSFSSKVKDLQRRLQDFMDEHIWRDPLASNLTGVVEDKIMTPTAAPA